MYRGARAAPAAPHHAPTAHLTAVAVDRRDPDQRRDLATGEPAEFGQLGEQGPGGGRADPGDGAQQVLPRAPGRAVPDLPVDVAVEGRDLALKGLDHRKDTLPHALGARRAEAVRLGHAYGHELAAARHQGLEGQAGSVFEWTCGWPHRLGEAGDRRGVEAVGLGQLAGGTGEVPHLARVDDRHRQTGRGEFGGDTGLQTTRGLQADQRRAEPGQALDQGRKGAVVVGNDPVLAGGADEDVEPVLGDVDADEGAGWRWSRAWSRPCGCGLGSVGPARATVRVDARTCGEPGSPADLGSQRK